MPFDNKFPDNSKDSSISSNVTSNDVENKTSISINLPLDNKLPDNSKDSSISSNVTSNDVENKTSISINLPLDNKLPDNSKDSSISSNVTSNDVENKTSISINLPFDNKLPDNSKDSSISSNVTSNDVENKTSISTNVSDTTNILCNDINNELGNQGPFPTGLFRSDYDNCQLNDYNKEDAISWEHGNNNSTCDNSGFTNIVKDNNKIGSPDVKDDISNQEIDMKKVKFCNNLVSTKNNDSLIPMTDNEPSVDFNRKNSRKISLSTKHNNTAKENEVSSSLGNNVCNDISDVQWELVVTVNDDVTKHKGKRKFLFKESREEVPLKFARVIVKDCSGSSCIPVVKAPSSSQRRSVRRKEIVISSDDERGMYVSLHVYFFKCPKHSIVVSNVFVP